MLINFNIFWNFSQHNSITLPLFLFWMFYGLILIKFEKWTKKTKKEQVYLKSFCKENCKQFKRARATSTFQSQFYGNRKGQYLANSVAPTDQQTNNYQSKQGRRGEEVGNECICDSIYEFRYKISILLKWK